MSLFPRSKDIRPCSFKATISPSMSVPTGNPYTPGRSSEIGPKEIFSTRPEHVEAMPSGGTLALRGYAGEEWLCLDIADTGDGVPEAMRSLNRPSTNKPQGSGLGLAIVREIVKQHKGTVSYTSQPGKGTTFHLKFPI